MKGKAFEPLPGGPFPPEAFLGEGGRLILFPECPRHPQSVGTHRDGGGRVWCSDCSTEAREREVGLGLLQGAFLLVCWMEHDPEPAVRASARHARQVLAEMKEWYRTEGKVAIPPGKG